MSPIGAFAACGFPMGLEVLNVGTVLDHDLEETIPQRQTHSNRQVETVWGEENIQHLFHDTR